jgi:2'-5' RNA ligase
MIYVQAPRDLFPDVPIDKPGHLTVVYMGKCTQQRFQEGCERAKAVARSFPPLHGTIGGLGFFEPTAGSDGNRVAYCPVYAEGLHLIRSMLCDLAAPESQPQFVPHITLAYLGGNDETGGDPPPSPITSARVCFRMLYVSRGPQICAYAFTGRHEPHGSGAHYRDRRPGEAPL